MPTSPVFILFYVIFQEKETGAVTNLMLCGYSSNASLTFPFRIIFFLIPLFRGARPSLLVATLQKRRGPVVSGGATGFTLQNVFSLWKGETELGLLTAGK